MIRHFTVSAFVSTTEATLLHWHAKNQMWLPPGGHVEANEDTIQAAHREVLEETGLTVAILPTAPPFDYAEPPQLPAPVTIMVEDIAEHPVDGRHQHIDSIYFTRPQPPEQPIQEGWAWVSAEALRANTPLSASEGAPAVEIAEDVRVLGLASIERAAEPR
ncbi:MAG: ADP-ribose pyrophosphatase YjhB, NUDIX family [Chloroflexi bacterium]|jgi:ADP-ribose pyrophosphatase YjhB (NUDIX family)|nr:MAG: ADP-ribose pyrophosphatase YjhB, NUDIX family [Chloroflexota bacterium]